jgi:hypothetical protein
MILLNKLHLKYNGPLPRIDRQKALFEPSIGRYECARAVSMVRHYSDVSTALVKTMRELGQSAIEIMQRRYHKEELALLLHQRRLWKDYHSQIENCPPI